MIPPPSAGWVQVGVCQGHVLEKCQELEGGIKVRPPPKILHHKGIPLSSVRLRVVSPSMRPFTWATSSQMGGRSSYPTTPHAKQRWSSKSAAILPEGALVEGVGRENTTPAVTTPYSAAVKACNEASDIPKASISCAWVGSIGYPLTPCVALPPGPMTLVGEVGGGVGWLGCIYPWLVPQCTYLCGALSDCWRS